MNGKTQSVVRGPGEGVHLAQSQAGGGVTFKVGAAETGGTLSIFESLRPAGDVGGPPLHRHDFDEAFYVLEGEYVIKIEDRLINAGVGSFVYIPGGTIHTLRHTGSGRGRLLTMCHPAGIEEIFAATSAEERATTDKKYGAENVGPPLPA
jgi:mannose-6-phosphate isomerase-like protein (cupin superfamily)